jgi:DeoR/GlpR family transcriptional regulator of sugar metabolism
MGNVQVDGLLGEGNFKSSAIRQARLLEHLRGAVFADAQGLREVLDVSIATIRRDLNELESRGLLKRMHGGATIINQATRDYSTQVREGTNPDEKARIGLAAAELVIEGDAVAIDSGTTSLQVARHLGSRQSLTFVTNGVDILAQLTANNAREIHFIGGQYIDLNRSLGGPLSVEAVKRFTVDKAILSVTAVDLDRGVIATSTPQISAVQRAMIEIARTVIVVADHSKFQRSALSVIAPLEMIDHIVTDDTVRPMLATASKEIQSKFIFV